MLQPKAPHAAQDDPRPAPTESGVHRAEPGVSRAEPGVSPAEARWSLPEEARVLIIRFSSLGDVVKCTALPRLIKARYPRARITFVTAAEFLELIAVRGGYFKRAHGENWKRELANANAMVAWRLSTLLRFNEAQCSAFKQEMKTRLDLPWSAIEKKLEETAKKNSGGAKLCN